MTELVIAGRRIGFAHAPFVVAEAGINHNGDIDRAVAMIRVAKEGGADAVKFQTFRAGEFIADPTLTFSYRSQGREVTESMAGMFERCELSATQWRLVAETCEREGIIFLSTPQNVTDLELLLTLGIPAVKVGSDDFVNRPLLRRFSAAGLPLLLSCGMADLTDIRQSLEAAGTFTGHPTALLSCTSQYPAPLQDVHARKLATLQAEFPEVVLGFSDHTRGETAAAVAVAFGARIFEKHFTLDHDLPGPDHWFSADPSELARWVRTIHEAWAVLGSGDVVPTAAEREIRDAARRFLTAARDIRAGERLSEANVVAMRVAGGQIPAGELDTLVGRTASRAYRRGEAIALGG